MVILARGVFVLVLLVGAAGCSLVTSLDGLSGGAADAGSSTPSEGGAGVDATADGSGGPDGATDGGDGDAATTYSFTDDFNRPNTTSGLGNGWIEKQVGFRLAGGEAERFSANSSDYRDTIATRPEAVADVEVSVAFRFKVGGGGYVQVHARAQTATVAQAGALDSYILFRNLNVADDKTFTLARQLGNTLFEVLTSFQSSSAIGTADRYRMRLRVTGTAPVELAAFVEVQSGGTWSPLGSASFSDANSKRISAPGVVGISAGNDPTGVFAYDDFSAKGL